MEAPSPGASLLIQKIGIDSAQTLLRYEAEEQNRYFMVRWEWTQMALAVVLAAVLYLGTHVSRLAMVICGIMLMLVIFMHFVLTPEITWLGRNLDFGPDPGGGGRTRYWILQALYSGLEVLKLLLGASLAIYLFVFKSGNKVRVRRAQTAEVGSGGREE